MDSKEKMKMLNEAETISKEIGDFIQSKENMSFGLAMSALALTIVKAASAVSMPREEMMKLFGLTLDYVETQKACESLMDRFFEKPNE